MKMNFRLLALALMAFMLVACSNDDKGKRNKPSGYVGFFNGVSGVATIKIEGEDRNFGSVSYESFGPGIYVEVGDYIFDVIQPNDQDASANQTLTSNQKFTVSDEDRTLVLVTGEADAVNVHQFLAAERPTEEEFEDAIDDGAVFINFIHVSESNKAENLVIFFLEQGETTSTTNPIATLAYGETTDRLQLSGDEEELLVFKSSDLVNPIYDSGKKTLSPSSSELVQSMILSDFKDVNGDSALAAYYFYSGTTEVWREKNGQTHVKLVNLHPEETVTATFVDLSGAQVPGTPSYSAIGFEQVTAYESFEIPSVDYLLNFDVMTTDFRIDLAKGVAQTIFFFGSKTSDKPYIAADNKNTSSTRVTFAVTHLAYAYKDTGSGGTGYTEDLLDFNVHVIKSGFGVPTNNTVAVEALSFRSQALVEVTDASTSYNVFFTNEDNDIIYAYKQVSPLALGDAFELVVYDSMLEGQSFEVLDVTEDVF
jgi:hypothetical protein